MYSFLGKYYKKIQSAFKTTLSAEEKLAFVLLDKEDLVQFKFHFKKYEINPNIQFNYQFTLLMSAVCLGMKNESISLQFIEFLLDQNADINMRDNQGRSALLMACHWNQQKIASYLIKRGADLDARTNQQQMKVAGLALNPLFSSLLKKQFELAYMLIEKGAKISIAMDIHNMNHAYKLPDESLEFLEKYQRFLKRVELLKFRKMIDIRLQMGKQTNDQISQQVKNQIFSKISPSLTKYNLVNYI